MSSSIGASAGIFTCDQPFGVGERKTAGRRGERGEAAMLFSPWREEAKASDGGVRKWELALLGKKQAVFPQNFTLSLLSGKAARNTP